MQICIFWSAEWKITLTEGVNEKEKTGDPKINFSS